MTTETAGAPEGDGLAQHIGQRLRACRAASNQTLSELSGKIGTHLNTVHKLEKGKGTIMLTQIEQLLNALGLELAVVPRGARELVENWGGWTDPELMQQAGSCCGTTDPNALVRHVRRHTQQPQH